MLPERPQKRVNSTPSTGQHGASILHLTLCSGLVRLRRSMQSWATYTRTHHETVRHRSRNTCRRFLR